jgi:magnesium chelatase subunit I
VRIPELVAEVAERVAFEARKDKRIDQRSGVSQRCRITVLENVVSNAERRALRPGEKAVVPRIGGPLCGASGHHGEDRAGVRGRAGGAGL